MAKILLTAFKLFLIVQIASPAWPDPVYRSADEKGVPVYSSKQKDPSAKPATLPPIVKAPIAGIKPVRLTCVDHGGINCQLGPDVDGSVVCYDNFRDSLQRFANSCTAARLDILEESYRYGLNDFSLVVRNTSAVAAKGVRIEVNRGAVFRGPDKLEPYGSAEFSLSSVPAKSANFLASCANCP